jgi:hypothetical protein
MKTNGKSLVLAGGLAVMALAWGASPARAQGFSFGYAGPGVSVGVNTGGLGYYGGGYYGGYPAVAPVPVVPGPVVVAPYAGVVVQRPMAAWASMAPGLITGPATTAAGITGVATVTTVATGAERISGR